MEEEIVEKYGLTANQKRTLTYIDSEWWKYNFDEDGRIGLINEAWGKVLICQAIFPENMPNVMIVKVNGQLVICTASIRGDVAIEKSAKYWYSFISFIFGDSLLLWKEDEDGVMYVIDEETDEWVSGVSVNDSGRTEIRTPRM
jgi:hypothetical protein